MLNFGTPFSPLIPRNNLLLPRQSLIRALSRVRLRLRKLRAQDQQKAEGGRGLLQKDAESRAYTRASLFNFSMGRGWGREAAARLPPRRSRKFMATRERKREERDIERISNKRGPYVNIERVLGCFKPRRDEEEDVEEEGGGEGEKKE